MGFHSVKANMSNLTDYMTLDEPRAVLGVSDEELEDVTLNLPLYVVQLEGLLEEVHPGLVGLYATVKASPTPSPAEQRFLQVTSVFSAYAIGQILLTSANLFAPKKIGDGRAETERVADPFEDVRDGVDATLITLRARLYAALRAIGEVVVVTPTYVARTLFVPAGLSVNPVTGI